MPLVRPILREIVARYRLQLLQTFSVDAVVVIVSVRSNDRWPLQTTQVERRRKHQCPTIQGSVGKRFGRSLSQLLSGHPRETDELSPLHNSECIDPFLNTLSVGQPNWRTLSLTLTIAVLAAGTFMSGRHAGMIGQPSNSYSDATARFNDRWQLVLMEFSLGTIDHE